MGTSSNLPPGVSVNDIPGNRPQDEWWETFTERLIVPGELMEIPAEGVARFVNAHLEACAVFYNFGFKDGRREEQLDRSFPDPEDHPDVA